MRDIELEVSGVQSYATQVGRVANALSGDGPLARRVIDAVHSGSGSAVEQIFKEIGVESQVTLTTVDGAAGSEARLAATTRSKTITVTIGIGPISISVTVHKESK